MYSLEKTFFNVYIGLFRKIIQKMNDFLFAKMHAKILSVCEVNYDRNLVEKLRKQKLGDKILKIKENVNERVQEIKEIKERRKSIQDELDKYEER